MALSPSTGTSNEMCPDRQAPIFRVAVESRPPHSGALTTGRDEGGGLLGPPGIMMSAQVCALDDALNDLARIDPRRAQVIELRFFGGLSVEETAHVLQVSPQTVMRDWRLARAWLARELI